VNLRLGLDLDSTTLAFMPHVLAQYKLWFDREIDPADCIEWDWPIELTHFKDYPSLFAWMDMAEAWRTMPFIAGAPGAIMELDRGNSIWFITQRSGNETVSQTRNWHMYSPFRHCGLYAEIVNKDQVPCSIYVDDAPHHIKRLVEKEKQVIVFDQPWNRKLGRALEKEVKRAMNWQEVLELIP